MSAPTLALIALGGALCLALFVLLIQLSMSRLVDRRIAAYQGDLLRKHYDEVNHIYRQMRGWRHDYHNHIQAMKAYLELGQLSSMGDYLRDLDADLTSVDTLIKTGNVMLDAVLGSKLSLAASRHIAVTAKASAPGKMAVSDIDLCVIMGNLLDNAAEACLRIEEESARFIRVYVGQFKGQLYISVTNAVGGEVKKAGERYLTSKGGSHGYGLLRVDRVVERYGGFINRQHEEDVFATEIMLPL